MAEHRIVVTNRTPEDQRSLYESMLGPLGELIFLKDVPKDRRAELVRRADVLVCWNPAREMPWDWKTGLERVSFLQLLSAGADHVPFDRIPSGVQVAANTGAYSKPMAEHALAMILAVFKRLREEHENLRRGSFNQQIPTRTLDGAICGILGFGGIGKATARLLRPLGARIYALNRSGKTDEPVDFAGTSRDLEKVLRASDVLLVSLPLKRSTRGLIGARELGWMKEDALLVNVARGEIIEQKALYEHLASHSHFHAAIDAWWVEPLRQGDFELDFPFMDLPNVLGSPHNSAMVAGSLLEGARSAAKNTARFLERGEPSGVLDPGDFLPGKEGA
ncbi:MAG: 2-hydroxyacid dehydrogenase [Acidobacteriota bacterium]